METGAMAEDIVRIEGQLRALCSTIERGPVHGVSGHASHDPETFSTH
jgi:hypothetical protein